MQVQSLGWEDPLEKEMATHSCLEHPMDRGAWQAIVHEVAKSWPWLSNWTTIRTLEKLSLVCTCSTSPFVNTFGCKLNPAKRKKYEWDYKRQRTRPLRARPFLKIFKESLELMKDNVCIALFLWTKVSYVITFKHLSLSIFKKRPKKVVSFLQNCKLSHLFIFYILSGVSIRPWMYMFTKYLLCRMSISTSYYSWLCLHILPMLKR